MIVSQKGRFVFLASTKSASTTIEAALIEFADVAIMNPPEAKHMSIQAFERHVAPLLGRFRIEDLETVAVIRHPIDWLASWYRYRSRSFLDGSPRSTAGVSFDQFVQAYLSSNQPEFAKVGRPARMLKRDMAQSASVDHLFAYDALPKLAAFFSARLGEVISFDAQLNASPQMDIDLSPDLERALTQFFADDIALFDSAIR